jgi:hypothetical protein
MYETEVSSNKWKLRKKTGEAMTRIRTDEPQDRERKTESEETPIREWNECWLFGRISCMLPKRCGGWLSSVQKLELNGRLVDKMHSGERRVNIDICDTGF